MEYTEIEAKEIERSWQRFLYKAKPMFKRKPDMQTVLFLIGVQELGQIGRSFSKEEKEDLMHIAVCTLLGREGYFRFDGHDEDGWPHFSTLKAPPDMSLGKRETWMKTLVLAYFDDMEKGNFSNVEF